MNDDPQFEMGLAALVDMYDHLCRHLGGADRVFAAADKGQAAAYFVAEYKKRLLDSGPQPTRPMAPVTNVYDDPRPDPTWSKDANVGMGPPLEQMPATTPAPPSPTEPPSGGQIAALLNEDA